jgi:hypothetical protein
MPSGHVIAYLTKVADKKLNRGVFKVSPHPSSSLIEDQESLIGLSRTKTDIAAALHRLLPPKAGGSSNARAATALLKSSNSTDYAARRVGNKFSNSIKALKTRKSGKTDVARAAFRTIRARARGTRRPRPGENADKALIRAPRRRIPSLAWQRRAGPVPYQNPVSLSSVHTRFKRRFRAQLGYNNFFRNVKIESFIKGLFAVAVHHASRVALRRWKRGHKTLKRKELRKVIAARLAPNVPAAKALTRRERDQRSYRVFSHLRSIVLRRIISSLSTSYTFARVNSPFASGGHFL